MMFNKTLSTAGPVLTQATFFEHILDDANTKYKISGPCGFRGY